MNKIKGFRAKQQHDGNNDNIKKRINIPKWNILSHERTLTQVNKCDYLGTPVTSDAKCANKIKS